MCGDAWDAEAGSRSSTLIPSRDLRADRDVSHAELARTDSQSAGDYVIHNPLMVSTDVYLSWYSDGIRVVDASDPCTPHEGAFFVPPSANNPVKPSERAVLSNAPQVWDVAYDEATGLIYASDMNSGLWILRRTDH